MIVKNKTIAVSKNNAAAKAKDTTIARAKNKIVANVKEKAGKISLGREIMAVKTTSLLQ